jgi:tetraacyldisaccharide 4'-kinase
MHLLPDADSFRRLVDGSLRGPLPAVARAGLAAASVPYGLAVAARNTAYDRGLLRVTRAPVPVICVGNLTLGGTGKTPLVAWVARVLERGRSHPAIVSRGYRADREGRSDEAAELAILLPGVPHVADRDRVAAARAAAARGADVVVLDDGFQHRRLARDLDIVAIDATDPFGGGRLFPRGLLREPLSGIARARAVVLTRAAGVAPERRAAIRTAVERAGGGRAAWVESAHRPVRLRSAGGDVRPLDDLRSRRVVAFAGIGNPAAFRDTLVGLGADLADFRGFPDHHPYSAGDLRALDERRRRLGADLVVTTLKDLVKARVDRIGDAPLFAVEIAIEMLSGGGELERLVVAAATGGGSSP